MSATTAQQLNEAFRDLSRDGLIAELFRLAAREDLGSTGDVTSRIVCNDDARGQAAIRAREGGTLAGLATFDMLCDAFGADLSLQPHVRDGEQVESGSAVAGISGRLRDLLALERTLLNLLGRLSGIATLTSRYVEAVAGTGVQVCDTRKTTPGLRALEKYAVRCGGGVNHRLGLYDAVMIKDNHLAGLSPKAIADTLREVMRRRQDEPGVRFVEVEVDRLDQLDAVFALGKDGPDAVLLDNMDPATLRQAAARRDAMRPELILEASGGVTLETVRAVAQTGVNRISVGAVTHSAVQLDFGLDIDPH